MSLSKIGVLLSVLLLAGCGKGLVETPSFDGAQAMVYLQAQVDLGPRVPGSEASLACRQFFTAHFDSLGIAVDTQSFDFFDPYSQTTIPCANLIASVPGRGEEKDRLVILAHYDSRPRTDYGKDPAVQNLPIAGANDGASGCAILMELGNILAKSPPPGPVDLLFVDAEDWGKPGDHHLYLMGSKEFARRGIRGYYRFGLLLDMVGDASQQIYREMLSQRYAGEVNDMVWDVAKRLGVQTFIDSSKYMIQDDHLSLNTGGVPTVDIIDFDYPYWHSQGDTPDKCSAPSLENVGRVVAEIIYNSELWPNKR